MTKKWPLFLGIILLTIGIILKTTTNFDPWSLIILLSGVTLKIIYIVIKVVRKEYKPGYEILLLLIGLTLFMGGIILHKNELIENPTILKTVGLSLKISFVVLFIRKTSKTHQQLHTH